MRIPLVAVCVVLVAISGCRDSRPQPPSLAELTTMLQSEDTEEQIKAAGWVVELGPKAAEIVPALTAALKSPHMGVRQNAAMALGRVGADAPGVVPALTAALDDREVGVQNAAATALGQFGSAASSAIPALERLSNLNHQGQRKGSSCDTAGDALKKIR